MQSTKPSAIRHYSNPKNHWIVLVQRRSEYSPWQAYCVCGAITPGEPSERKARAAWKVHLPEARAAGV